jgi:hypothetical protein
MAGSREYAAPERLGPRLTRSFRGFASTVGNDSRNRLFRFIADHRLGIPPGPHIAGGRSVRGLMIKRLSLRHFAKNFY